jgi:hypothetical protein
LFAFNKEIAVLRITGSLANRSCIRNVLLILTHPSLINEYPHKLQSVSSKNTADMIDSLTSSFMTLLIHISPADVFTNANKGDVEPPGIACLHSIEFGALRLGGGAA